jgi:hypothetical protein
VATVTAAAPNGAHGTGARLAIAELQRTAAAEASIDAIAARDVDSPEEIAAATRPPVRVYGPDLRAYLTAAAKVPWVDLRIADRTTIATVPVGGIVVLTGASGAGKSSLAIDVAIAHAVDVGPVVYVSTELSHAEVAARIVANRCGLPWDHTLTAGGDTADAVRALDDLGRLVVLADDDATTAHMVAAVEALRLAHPDVPIFVVCDYLQNLRDLEAGRDERSRVSAGAEGMRRAAKEHRFASLIVSQTSRPAGTALRKGEMVGIDTATSGAESSQIERGAYVTLSLGDVRPGPGDGDWQVAMSIGKERFGRGDAVQECVFHGPTGRFRAVGQRIPASEYRAGRDAARDSGAIDTLKLAILAALDRSDAPMSAAGVKACVTGRSAAKSAAVAALLGDGSAVRVLTRKSGGAWPIWTPDRAAAAGLRTEGGA